MGTRHCALENVRRRGWGVSSIRVLIELVWNSESSYPGVNWNIRGRLSTAQRAGGVDNYNYN